MLTNDHNKNTRVLKTVISDHFVVLLETNFFVETKTAKKEALTFRNFNKARKNDNYCCTLLFKLLREPQKIDYNEKNLDELFDKFSRTLKNQLNMYFLETTSQPMERPAFGIWKSRRAKNCFKERQKLFRKFSENQNETNWQQYSEQRKLCTRTIWLAKHVKKQNSIEQLMARNENSFFKFVKKNISSRTNHTSTMIDYDSLNE